MSMMTLFKTIAIEARTTAIGETLNPTLLKLKVGGIFLTLRWANGKVVENF